MSSAIEIPQNVKDVVLNINNDVLVSGEEFLLKVGRHDVADDTVLSETAIFLSLLEPLLPAKLDFVAVEYYGQDDDWFPFIVLRGSGTSSALLLASENKFKRGSALSKEVDGGLKGIKGLKVQPRLTPRHIPVTYRLKLGQARLIFSLPLLPLSLVKRDSSLWATYPFDPSFASTADLFAPADLLAHFREAGILDEGDDGESPMIIKDEVEEHSVGGCKRRVLGQPRVLDETATTLGISGRLAQSGISSRKREISAGNAEPDKDPKAPRRSVWATQTPPPPAPPPMSAADTQTPPPPPMAAADETDELDNSEEKVEICESGKAKKGKKIGPAKTKTRAQLQRQLDGLAKSRETHLQRILEIDSKAEGIRRELDEME